MYFFIQLIREDTWEIAIYHTNPLSQGPFYLLDSVEQMIKEN